MLVLRPFRIGLLLTAALTLPQRALAQSTPAATATAAKRVYTPADFARFAPKTAYDMLAQVPSFTIHGASNERGLGQASENVLINGQRIANKSGGAIDALQRTSAANVDRIEIVEAASLGIAGLSGQVANVILKAATSSSGQFEYNPSWRAHFAKPEWLGGSISYSGKSGPVDYTVSIKNNYGRGGWGGPIWISDGNGVVTETRQETYHGENEQANMQLKLGLDGPGSSVGNLTLGYTPYWYPSVQRDHRVLATGEERSRDIRTRLSGYFADINADYEFALGPGRLKLIGVRHWEHEPLIQTLVLTFDTTGADSQGTRFSRDTHLGETIGRGEYHWKTGKNDWQISFERAFNSLDQKGRLFNLDPSGEFVEVPFPEGTGKVTELRYEGIATLSRPLTS
ncbi:MAG TPA: TonB-dependent receptor plug domain-containing protein, partial [Sphingomicrobium sp.]